MSWLNLVPVSSDAYVYQAALYCEDCGRALVERAREAGTEDDGDSGTFPQGPYPYGGGEADSAHFCDSGRGCLSAVEVAGHKVGCPLNNPLTSEGAEAVVQSVRRDLVSSKKFDRMLGRLLARVWGDYLQGGVGRVLLPGRLPGLEKLVGRRYALDRVVLADSRHLYLLGQVPTSREVRLLRAGVDDEGEFDSLEDVAVPPDAVVGYGAEKLLMQAVEDGAWD
jgi:hypothetical protein